MDGFQVQDETSTRPKIFGAGMERKHIAFVPESQHSERKEAAKPDNLGDRYLSIVLGKEIASSTSNTTLQSENGRDSSQASENATCAICGGLVDADESAEDATTLHDLSVAHQSCLEHSYPPSHLDHRRQGVRYLKAHGWDINGRKGLGVNETGRLAPVKARTKNDTVGLGMNVPLKREVVDKPRLLDAGNIRKMDDADRYKHQKLQRLFYQSDDVSRYLGES